MKIHVIINPSSGKETGKQSGDALADRLSEMGHAVSRTYTREKGDATKAARLAADNGEEMVVACGGDGTANEVVQGLATRENPPALTIFAQGTVNDFATQLQLPADAYEMAELIDRNHRMALDIGQINDEYFLNVASFGNVSKIGHDVDTDSKTMLGRLAYVMEGIRVAPDLLRTPMPMRIELDTGEVIEGDYLFAGIANSRSVGGFSRFAPRALVNDGLLDLVTIERTDVMTLGQILMGLRRGSHLEHKQVACYQAKEFSVTAEDEVAIDIDGEEAGVLPARVRVLPARLSCIIP